MSRENKRVLKTQICVTRPQCVNGSAHAIYHATLQVITPFYDLCWSVKHISAQLNSSGPHSTFIEGAFNSTRTRYKSWTRADCGYAEGTPLWSRCTLQTSANCESASPKKHAASQKKNSVALVRERTIPTKRPPPVGDVSANFCG